MGKVLKSSKSNQNQKSLPIRGLSAAILAVGDHANEESVTTMAWNMDDTIGFDGVDLEIACRPYLQQLTSEVASVRQVGMADIQVSTLAALPCCHMQRFGAM